MDITITTTTTAGETGPSAIPACCYPPPAACTGSGASSTNNQSRVLAFLRALAAFCWAASRGALGKMFLAYLQSTVNPTWRSLVASLGVGVGSTAPGGGIPVVVDVDDDDDDAQGRRPLADAHHTDAGASAAANSKKVSWSYLRGVSLALSELCQDCCYGGGRIPLAAILDLMRQHQSAFVPLGPHAEKDVPKRLIQLAHEKVVFFDPFKEFVIVPEEIRQKYASRRRELLAKGVDPADLSVFGAALTQDLSPSQRVTNAAVASYKEQFLLTQRQHKKKTRASNSHALTREESLMSIADAICPAAALTGRPETELPDRYATRRGHSIVTDIAKIIGCQQREDRGRSDCWGNESRCGFGRPVLPEVSTIIHQRDALEVENNRLRTILGLQ